MQNSIVKYIDAKLLESHLESFVMLYILTKTFFVARKINTEKFKTLSDEEIDELIPDATCRQTFKTEYSVFRHIMDNSSKVLTSENILYVQNIDMTTLDDTHKENERNERKEVHSMNSNNDRSLRDLTNELNISVGSSLESIDIIGDGELDGIGCGHRVDDVQVPTESVDKFEDVKKAYTQSKYTNFM